MTRMASRSKSTRGVLLALAALAAGGWVLVYAGLPVGTYEVLGTLVDAAGHDQIAVRGYLRVID